MIVILPCAGNGRRRLPETLQMPKILLQHDGERLMDHIVQPIIDSEQFERLVFVLSPQHGQQVIEYVHRRGWEIPIQFVWQNEPLGFGHAVLQARDEVFSFKRWNPPVLIHTDDAVNTHSNAETNLIADITASDVSQIGVAWRGNVRDYGMVLNDGPRVERLVEKPNWGEGGLALTGIYYIRESRRLFRCLNKLVKTRRILNGEYHLTHALQLMIDAGTPFLTYYHDWTDCGQKKIKESRRESESG